MGHTQFNNFTGEEYAELIAHRREILLLDDNPQKFKLLSTSNYLVDIIGDSLT